MREDGSIIERVAEGPKLQDAANIGAPAEKDHPFGGPARGMKRGGRMNQGLMRRLRK
jgi:hypothetical protein